MFEETCLRIGDPSSARPWGSSVWRIPEREADLFWVGFYQLPHGAQIAFGPNLTERLNSENTLFGVRLRLLGGEETVRRVFVAALLGYGTDQLSN